MHINASVHGAQKRALNSLEMGLQEAGNCSTWLLGIKTWVLCKNSTCLWPLHRVFSPNSFS